MPQVKRKTPEQFVAQSPIGERLLGGCLSAISLRVRCVLLK